MDCATAPDQLECHEMAEAGGVQVILQHGLGEALMLVQEVYCHCWHVALAAGTGCIFKLGLLKAGTTEIIVIQGPL